MKQEIFNISENALSHLTKRDPLVGRLIKEAGVIRREVIADPFIALVQSVVFQQLAIGAASIIYNRLIKSTVSMTPSSINNTSDSVLKECGLSGPKISYIKNIAIAFLDGTLSNDKLLKSSDNDVVDMLVSIKGIGKWTADMFLIFCLKRKNVFSYKDLGLRKGVVWLYGLDSKPSENFCIELTEKWKPYSSIVSLYLWEITIQNFFKISAKKLFYDYLEDEKSKICYYDSPIGLLEISTSSKGLKSLSFVDKRQWDECEQPSPLIKSIKKQLSEYFNGTRYTFDIPINYHGTSFQKQVWQSLNLISYGETKNYGEVAKIVGSPKASRAVGGANNKNKIAIIVPCHRVIGANGNLTGYIGGLYKKKWLIQHENKNRLD